MTKLLPCPFCKGQMQFRKALWPSDGCTDAIIHAAATSCGMGEYSDDTSDESIITKWNTRLAAQSAAPVGEDISKDSTLYVERSMVRIGAIGSSDETMLKYVDSLPVFTAADFAAPAPSPPEVVGWQDISTAPRNGTHILCYHPKYDMVLNGVWDGGDLNCFEMKDERLEYVKDFYPTHWMPLPANPGKTEP